MNHRSEHSHGNKEKPASPKKVAPASPDPHAGHDMSKPMKPGVPQKGAAGK